MQLSDFEYKLPPELIAQDPSPRRGESRLLVLDREGDIQHRRFQDVLDLFLPGDLAVFNNTKVFPARLFGARPGTGGKAEALLLGPRSGGEWNVLLRPARRTRPGTIIDFGHGLIGRVRGRDEKNTVVMEFEGVSDLMKFAWDHGSVPLPPYIRRDRDNPRPGQNENDRERYQTVYASRDGAIAAPTAGLHFTKELLEKMKNIGVKQEFVTLHVGVGTFQPVRTPNLEEHRMHTEFYRIETDVAQRINQQVAKGGRLWLIGTTTVRALESAAVTGQVCPGSGWTDIFIKPGYEFHLPFNLITNFHLPGSTLLMLVSALAGRKRILDAYEEAVREKYRFFSYGDAMAIVGGRRQVEG